MKRTQKRILGFFGLTLVVAATFFAAMLPGPEASAIDTVTDNLVVRVIGDKPNVEIEKIENDSAFVNPIQSVPISYESVDKVVVTIEYTDANNITRSYTIKTIDDIGYAAGSDVIDLDLSAPGFGYGRYVLRVSGEVEGKVLDQDSVAFSFYPVIATVSEDPDNGLIYADLEYDDTNGDIDRFEINLYDKYGNLVKGFPTITATPPTKRVELPFSKYDLPFGEYTVSVITYGKNGQVLYKAYDTIANYEAIKTPDTGNAFKNLNISQTDYLITGLVVFFLVGISGLWFVKTHKR